MDSIYRVEQKINGKLAQKIEEPKFKKSPGEWLAASEAIDRPENRLERVWNPRGIDSYAAPEFSGSVSDDRRATRRMPIERAVCYRVIRGNGRTTLVGSGRTLDMSSGGILFTTESALTKGDRVKVSVSWPARLNDVVPLQLVTIGRVVRVEGTRAAIAIERYEFKTLASTIG